MTRVQAALLGVLTTTTVSAAPADNGLILHYDFDAGAGQTLRDRSGNGLDATIYGARWEELDRGHALRFDGADAVVDGGDIEALRLTERVTVETWVYPDRIPKGEARIVGKDYGSYVLTYYVNGKVYWYISSGGNNCRTDLTPGSWHHVVGTFDGAVMALYVDGELRDRRDSKHPTIGPGKSFRMAVARKDFGQAFAPEAYFTAQFKGMLDEVRVYDRAITAKEVVAHFRATVPVRNVVLGAYAYTYAGEVIAELDLKGLRELPDGASAEIALARPGEEPLKTSRVTPLRSWGSAEAILRVGTLVPGRYEARAVVRDRAGRSLADPVVVAIDWPATPKPPKGPGKRLNNLVTELLSVTAAAAAAPRPFTLARDSCVLVKAARPLKATITPRGGDAREIALVETPAGTAETMLFLPAGDYAIRPVAAVDYVLRTVPELIYCKFLGNPQVTPYGPFDLPFLKQHVLSNVNCLVVGDPDASPEFLRTWGEQGRRAIQEVYAAPYFQKWDADKAYDYWAERPGMTHPLLHGVIVDEFSAGDDPVYDAMTASVRRLRADPKYAARDYYPYCAPMHGARKSEEFIRAVMDMGSRFALERYLPEQPTLSRARRFLDRMLVQDAAAWRERLPGSVEHMILCFGHFLSAPPESVNTHPSVDHKVYMDMQFNILANHPNFAGLYGVMEYTVGYADEEYVRWAARLYRHYGIEGNTGMLSEELGYTYALTHVENPDFADGTSGWEITAGEPGSVTVGRYSGYSFLQGRYPKTNQGDTFLVAKRGAGGPNTLAQTIRHLKPGRLYSLKLFTGDRGELLAGKSTKREHAVSIGIEDVAPVEAKCFRHVFANCYSHHVGRFDRENNYWMNLHQRLFRANSTTARLTVSDWASPDTPGGPVGQELMFNFVEVQPYFE